ncbi:hypothetical protein [Pseudomonas aeruginosa]|uniref:hypothetical protein n=1 Tax=Pseudomonas aeruginosa TaxID=287 RepID=UPI00177C3ED7|nr:hypothetical protein [Pseudomonas aeruginosa]
MTESKICTCPSGDGSLRWPCPAHPAVEQADVAAKLTFINGRPAMCGCQVEYSDGGGEYSDVIYVTLCAKHSGSAILDLVATNRIALTPEYEGQWHADLYLDREIPLAKVEGATPAEAVLALMSAERIDPEQESVEQAGGERRDALQSIMEWTAAENIPDDRKLCLIRNAARAALAQPSPKCVKCGGTGEADSGGVHPWGEPVLIPCDCETEKAEAGRSEVERLREENANLILACASLDSEKREMRHKWDAIIAMRDAALARVEELELKLDKSDYAYDNDRIHMRGLAARAIARAKVFDDGSDGADAESARSVVAILRELLAVGPAQAQHSVPEASEQEKEQGWTLDYRFVERVTELAASRTEYTTSMEATEQVLLAARELLAAAPGKEGV